MKEPMLTLVENAIRASLGPAADTIPRKDFKVASLAVLMAMREPTNAMLNADGGEDPRWDDIFVLRTWRAMIDAAMQGA